MIYLTFTNTETDKVRRSVQVVRGLTVGRSSGADIRLEDDETLSRLHALVVPKRDGRLELRDLSSTAGTFIKERGEVRRLMPEAGEGGAEKGRAILAVGEEFFMGRYKVKICFEDVLGEPTLHPPLIEEEEITGLEKADK